MRTQHGVSTGAVIATIIAACITWYIAHLLDLPVLIGWSAGLIVGGLAGYLYDKR